jgi:hypothetical protein
VRDFCAQLRQGGVNATIRKTRGTSIDAACGQLRANHVVPPSPADATAAGAETESVPVPVELRRA